MADTLWAMRCYTTSEMEASIMAGSMHLHPFRVADGFARATPEEVLAQSIERAVQCGHPPRFGTGIVVAEVVPAGIDTDGCPLMRPTGRYVTYPRED